MFYRRAGDDGQSMIALQKNLNSVLHMSWISFFSLLIFHLICFFLSFPSSHLYPSGQLGEHSVKWSGDAIFVIYSGEL